MKKLYFILMLFIYFNLYSQDYKGVWLYDAHNAATMNKVNRDSGSVNDVTDVIAWNDVFYTHKSLKGVMLFLTWDQLQSTSGTYNWSSYFDAAINKILQTNPNLKIGISIWTGKYAPSWLYSSGVAQLKTDKGIYPDYLDLNSHPALYVYSRDVNDIVTTTYEDYWRAMISAVINHINDHLLNANTNVPPWNNIFLFQSAEGSTGDLSPYKGDPVKDKFVIENVTGGGDSEWQKFVKRCWAYTQSQMLSTTNQPNNIKDKINLMLNTGGPAAVFYPEDLNNPNLNNLASESTSSIFHWVTNANSNIPDVNTYLAKSWRKADGQGHWYQLNYEQYSKKVFDNLKATNSSICTRDEFDLSSFNDPDPNNPDPNNFIKLTAANPSNIYATAANALNSDLDIWCIFASQLYPNGVEMDDVYNMFNALKKIQDLSNANLSTGAYCFLKDGLDANDFSRFSSVTNPCSPSTPTPNFYTGSSNCGRTWCTNIASSKYWLNINHTLLLGAEQRDPDYAQGVPSHQYLGVRDYNDVGWYTFNSVVNSSGVTTSSYGNSENFMHQLNANSTSVGSWKNATSSSISTYDRFGRQIRGQSTNNALNFDVNDNVGKTVCAAGTTKVYQINIIYLDDASNSTWQLYYGNNQTYNVTNDGSHGGAGWKILTYSAGTCLTFNNGGVGSDFSIKNTDEIVDKFSFVSVTTTCPVAPSCTPIVSYSSALINLFPSQLTSKIQNIIYSDNSTSDKLKSPLATVFPNPSQDYTTVTFNNMHLKCTLILSSMQGKQLYQKTLGQINKGMSEKISLKDFAKGIYFLKISCDDEAVQTEKIIVE